MNNNQQLEQKTMQQPTLQDFQQQFEEKQSEKLFTEDIKKEDTISIYVGNLPYDTLEDKLQTLFEQFGTVYSVTLIKNKMTGRARGFGFVKMDIKNADLAIESLDGIEFGGRDLHVSKAKERGPRPPRRDYRSSRKERRSYYGSRSDDSYQNGYSSRSGGYRGKSRYESSRSGERYTPYKRRFDRERDFPSEYDERRGQE